MRRRIATFGVLLLLVGAARTAPGQVGVRATFLPGEASDIVGFRYMTKTVENPAPLKIIFCGSRLSGNGTDPAPYFFETNLYTDRLVYADGTCTTWPMLGGHFNGQASIRLAFADYVKAGKTGVKTFDPATLPRQTYEIDGIEGLWKTDGISQQDLTGAEIGVEATRGEIVTDEDGWKCAGSLDASTYRQWNVSARFSGASHPMAFAALEESARYAWSGEVMNFFTEFLQYPGVVRVLVWDAQVLRESWPYWTAVPLWTVTQSADKPAGTYGVRKTTWGGKPALEIANDASAPYATWDSVLDLGRAPEGEAAADLVVDTFVVGGGPGLTVGSNLPVSVSVRNTGSSATGPFRIGFGFHSSMPASVLSSRMSTTLCAVDSGLEPGQTFNCDVPIVVPAGNGTFHLSAFADALGSVVESDKANNVRTHGVLFEMIPCPLPTSWDLSADFARDGLRFESLSRDGSSRVPLQYRSSLDLTNGDIRTVGPGWVEAQAFYPYAMLDEGRATLLLHPGGTNLASVGVPICAPGKYRIRGSFARGNNFRNAGDGVVVGITRSGGAASGVALLNEAISSNHDVPTGDYFAGTGVVTFDRCEELVAGDVVRFTVASGDAEDLGFDATALRADVTRVTTGECARSSFHTLTPCRVVNTRRTDFPEGLGAPPIGAVGSPDRILPLVAGACGIPATATAVVLNVTAADTQAAGYLTLHSGDGETPATSTINFAAGQVRANNAFLPLASDGSGTIKVRSGSTGTLNLLIDVVGYFE